MSVSNIVGSALASALSPPVQKPAAPPTDSSSNVAVAMSAPAPHVQAHSLSQPVGKDVLASLLQLQSSRGFDSDADADAATGVAELSEESPGRRGRGTLETGNPDPSQTLASGAPATDAMPATTWSASSTYSEALRVYVQTKPSNWLP